MLTHAPLVQELKARKAQRLALAYRIERADASFVRFTTHNSRLQVNVGTLDVPLLEWFEPVGAPSPESASHESGVSPASTSSTGPLHVEAITAEDVRIGLYRKAELHLYVVDWRFPWIRYSYERFIAGEVSASGEQITIQWLGIASVADVNVGGTYTRMCRHRLGDARCKVDLSLIGSGTKTVDSVAGWSDAHPRQRFRSDLTGQPDKWWQFGRLYWLTGNNAINQMNGYDVRRSLQANGEVELWTKTPYDIAPGDTFRVEPGCDKLKSTCFTKFDNVPNFGGYPWMKPADHYTKAPTAKN